MASTLGGSQFGSKIKQSFYQLMASPPKLNLLMSILLGGGEVTVRGENTGESGQLPSPLAPCRRRF